MYRLFTKFYWYFRTMDKGFNMHIMCYNFTFLTLFLLLTLLHMAPFPPLGPPPPSPCHYFPLPPHCCLRPRAMNLCSLANPVTFFHPFPTTLFPSDSCQSFPWIQGLWYYFVCKVIFFIRFHT